MRGQEWFTILVSLALICLGTAAATKENKTTPNFPDTKNITPRDEIYIDDEGIEGSGGRGEIHDDLEKESDFSGSGFGPDDEDSTTDHHHSTVHQSSFPSSVVEHSGNSDKNRQDKSNRKETGRVTEYELGSGESDVHYDDNEDNIVESVVTEHNEIDRKEEGGNVKDNGSDIFTIVTDPNEHVADITDRSTFKSAEPGVVSKNTPKLSEIDLELGKPRNLPTDQINLNSEEVLIMNTKNENRAASFFAQPGILAAVIGGAVVGLLCAILVVMFIVYRMRKKDEGSYALDEPKRSPALNSYAKNGNNREFFA